jgi:hypothetical protein
MNVFRILSVFFIMTFAFSALSQAQEKTIPNPLIDSSQFQKDVIESQKLREKRRVTENEFLSMALDENTIILDTRSAAKFKELHIAGAKHLNFSDITKDTLAKVIANKNTRVLIYCNNNFGDEPKSFPTKIASSALNLSTFTTLYSYGYKNIYELGPVLNVKTAKLKFR